MNYFSGIKVGDKVWSFEFGWGEVEDIKINSKFPILVNFKEMDYKKEYNFDGKAFLGANQTLFWDEIKFNIPNKLKIKLKNNYDKYIKEPKIVEASYSGKSIDQLRKIARLLALRDQECVDSRGYDFVYGANNYHIFKNDDGFYTYGVFQYTKNFSVFFKSKDDVQKICNILNSGKFNLKGE